MPGRWERMIYEKLCELCEFLSVFFASEMRLSDHWGRFSMIIFWTEIHVIIVITHWFFKKEIPIMRRNFLLYLHHSCHLSRFLAEEKDSLWEIMWIMWISVGSFWYYYDYYAYSFPKLMIIGDGSRWSFFKQKFT